MNKKLEEYPRYFDLDGMVYRVAGAAQQPELMNLSARPDGWQKSDAYYNQNALRRDAKQISWRTAEKHAHSVARFVWPIEPEQNYIRVKNAFKHHYEKEN